MGKKRKHGDVVRVPVRGTREKQTDQARKLSAIIKSGKTEEKYLSHIFALFTDVPVTDILAFAEKFDISLPVIKTYYLKHVKKYYRNHELEEVFTFK